MIIYRYGNNLPQKKLHKCINVEGVQFALVYKVIIYRLVKELLKHRTACSELLCTTIWMLRFLSSVHTYFY